MSPGLIGSAEAVGIRTALSVFRVHLATITPVSAGAEDAHGNATRVPGTPRTGVACKYRADDRVRVDEGGTLILRAPTLTLAHDDVIDEGDLISDIRDSEGVVLVAGPLEIGPPAYSAGLGPSLSKKLILRSAEVTL